MCEHHHDHDHDHPHDHGHTGLEERVAMLTYMLGHNQHHAQELHELAHDLGDSEAAQLIHDAVWTLRWATRSWRRRWWC